MANLDQLETRVNQLKEDTSHIFQFRDVFGGIMAAAQDTDVDEAKLRVIVGTFRDKIPNDPIYSRMEDDIRDLDHALMTSTVKTLLGRIKARNDLLADLTGRLKTQNDKAVKDANRLKQITEAVDKATKTVEEVKALVDKLEDSDAGTKAKLKELIESLGRIGGIFKPKEA